MHDEEFVKLRFWLDAELTLMRVFLALILGFVVDKKVAWIVIGLYIVFSIFYAATRISYVESKHNGYIRLPRR